MLDDWNYIENDEDYPQEEVSVLLSVDGGPELDKKERFWQMVGFWLYSGFFNQPTWFDDRGMIIEEGRPFAWKELGPVAKPRIYVIGV